MSVLTEGEKDRQANDAKEKEKKMTSVGPGKYEDLESFKKS